MNSATDSFTIYDKDLCLIEVNNKTLEMFQSSKEKDWYLGKHIEEIIPNFVIYLTGLQHFLCEDEKNSC